MPTVTSPKLPETPINASRAVVRLLLEKSLLEGRKRAFNAAVGQEGVVEGGGSGERGDKILMDGGEGVEWGVYGWADCEDAEVEDVTFFAKGSYNYLWLVTISSGGKVDESQRPRRFILRIPIDTLLPHQLLNEVATLRYVFLNVPGIPVPEVYAFDAGTSLAGVPFIAEEYIEGQPLATTWHTYTLEEKNVICRNVAKIIVEMAETSFATIGGLTLEHRLGPAVEGAKLFGIRGKFHLNGVYNNGPYNLGPHHSTKEYVIACYDNEIYHCIHDPESEAKRYLSESIPLPVFLQTLQETRQSILDDSSNFQPEEPFVLVHGDFHGLNMLVSGAEIIAVLDWEFAGVYPLSIFLSDEGVDLMGSRRGSDTLKKENSKWGGIILKYVKEMVSHRWTERDIKLLLESKNKTLQLSRGELPPRDIR